MECLSQNLIEIRAWAEEQNQITRERILKESLPSAEEILEESE